MPLDYLKERDLMQKLRRHGTVPLGNNHRLALDVNKDVYLATPVPSFGHHLLAYRYSKLGPLPLASKPCGKKKSA